MNQASRLAGVEAKWWVCGLLMSALMLNYMDRQVLALTIVPIQADLHLSDSQYGFLEKCFGYAFALGGVLIGAIADKVSIRWLYPIIVVGWSMAGIATGYADRLGEALFTQAPQLMGSLGFSGETPSDRWFAGFALCRSALGLFEAGQWPCALVTTMRLLSPTDRPFGNSLLQSGASLGAIVTPFFVNGLLKDDPGGWRLPFVVVGSLGFFWVFPWLLLSSSAARVSANNQPGSSNPIDSPALNQAIPLFRSILRVLALILVVVSINLTWHFFRAWLPKMLEQFHGYHRVTVGWFTSCYFIATDLGCITSGFLVKYLAHRGLPLHWSRVLVFTVFLCLTSLSVVAANLQAGWLLLGLFLVIGFGSLGLFPIYYSLTQEISTRHMGKLTGLFGFVTWIMVGEMQQRVGNWVQMTGAYDWGIFWAGLFPVIGWLGLVALWGKSDQVKSSAS